MDNIDGVGGIGGNGGIGGLKPTLQPALCPRCTSYARLAFLISSILRNTLRPLKKFQTVLDSDFKCNTSVLVVGTDSRIKHLAF
ncbi:hypothetical protein, partial [Neisseria meningitidis]|uniref:hypothetical protein n=1 Tax=Neisseria meningitidis TaxID=487 RepID=UPI0022A9BB51